MTAYFGRPSSHGAPQAGNNSGEASRGILEGGVRSAYAVIDEYMRCGYETARNLHGDPNKRGDMSDNDPNYGNRYNPWGPMAPLVEPWMMATQAWMNAWSAFFPGAWPQAWNPANFGAGFGYPTGAQSAAPPSQGTAPNVCVQLDSDRPTEVTANLNPGADLLALKVDSLKAEGCAEPIDDVWITSQPGRVRVSVKVEPSLPAGTYSGVIRKADRSVAGKLVVIVGAPKGE